MVEKTAMLIKTGVIFSLLFGLAMPAFSLEPDEILIVANSDIAASVRIAQYYREKRDVPAGNVLALPLGAGLNDTITRNDYEKQLAKPIRKKLSSFEFGAQIKCLLTTYGVPIKVGRRGPLKDQEDKLRQLKKLAKREKTKIEQLKQNGVADTSKKMQDSKRKLAQLQSEIDFIAGKETNASVDSELSMVLLGDYELYRWQPNRLKDNLLGLDFNTLMVSRLDGPSFEIAKGLIDKAITAELKGLNGVVYIDSGHPKNIGSKSLYAEYDKSLRETAQMIRQLTAMKVVTESTKELFAPGTCPQAAIYCGWYSLRKYVDAFDFADGAIGYHISSWEAVDLRDPNSSQWCPAMLEDGITATLGAVAEPYLHSFPQPKEFFRELFNGGCLVEAYYRTKPFNSWQLVLIGDPMYRPFKDLKKY